MNLKDYIADVKDFPVAGILFRDITPLLGNGKAFNTVCELITAFAKKVGAEVIAGPESRGFIFGCPVSTNMNIGFVPIRKPNKLPRDVVSQTYDLEYGTNTLCLHKDAVVPGQKVVIVDDLLATGGTLAAAIKLIESLGGIVVGVACVIELEDLKGRDTLSGYDVFTVVKY